MQRRKKLFIKDAGLSIDWNVGAENPIRLNLIASNIIPAIDNIKRRMKPRVFITLT